MDQQLATTNILLGIMAVVSLLEGLLIIGVGVAGFVVYRQIMRAIAQFDGFEERQIAPVMMRVHAVLADVKDVTGKVKDETARVDHAIRSTIDRVDDTADRVRHDIRAKARRAVGIVRGVRAAIEGFLQSQSEATGRF